MSYYQSYSSVKVQNFNGAELNNYELHVASNKTVLDYRVSQSRWRVKAAPEVTLGIIVHQVCEWRIGNLG